MADKQFVDGLQVKAPRQGSPEFIKGSLSIKREDLIKWLQGYTGEWINVDLKESKKGSWYAEVNTWKPENKKPTDDGVTSKSEDFPNGLNLADSPF
jgi:hypothetical protein